MMFKPSKSARATVAIATASLFALGLTACSGSAAPTTDAAEVDSDVQQLYDLAKEEGTLNLYGMAGPDVEPLLAQFKQAYPGIDVVGTVMWGSDTDTRLEGESNSGGFRGDVLWTGVTDLVKYSDRGWLTDDIVPEGADVPDGEVGPSGQWANPVLQVYPVLYNTSKVSAADVPQTWQDLVDPQWKGAIAIGDPSVSNSSSQSLNTLMEHGVIDEDWLDDFADTVEPKIFPSNANAIQSVATGESAMQLNTAYGAALAAKKSGAPVDIAWLSDGTATAPLPISLLADSPNPNAGKLFIHYLFSEQGQDAIAKYLNYPGVMEGAPTPADTPSLDEMAALSFPPIEELTTTFPQRLAIFGAVFK